MRVYNLSDRVQVYKGKPLAPNGGYGEFQLSYIPPRDLNNKNLAFGSLPDGWKPAQPKEEPAPVVRNGLVEMQPEAVAVEAVPEAPAAETAVEESSGSRWNKKKR